ncbi:putative motility protein [Paenibacillus ehimensis]|uniref:putative motility protein n=1 Tax=Paenibacillus ehimensis TaxID=79264 RepID=UPI002DC0509F|nr:putative motility protein [Paenibacillus ehimensis]MEC0213228.1 putative motility protein [Paenibacillus ehimensis]
MQINAALNAISGGNALKQAVGIALLSQMKDAQASQAAMMLQDFAAAQHPNLGKNLDIRV